MAAPCRNLIRSTLQALLSPCSKKSGVSEDALCVNSDHADLSCTKTDSVFPFPNTGCYTLKGLYQLSNRTLWLGPHFEQRVGCLRLQENVLHSRALRCGHYALQTITKTESPKATNTQKAAEHKTKQLNQEEEEEDDDEEDNSPEYIPKRKAKNPMMKIGYAWMIGLPTGVIGFILAKRQVDKNRLKQLRIRQRMKQSNEEEYDSNRYKVVTRTQ